jgi:hypothetical protein
VTIIDENGERLHWTAKYWHYGRLYEEECDSLYDALDYLEDGEDAGNLSSDSILDPDGNLYLNKPQWLRIPRGTTERDQWFRVYHLNREREITA